MKTFTLNLFIAFFLSPVAFHAQNITTVEAKTDDISNNLDLELVATLFGEAIDLEDFEYSLNNPYTRVSNLDLNEDGEVDYLRVVANSMDNAHLITIQAVLGFDHYQDVATIDVEKNSDGEAHVQVVGDEYLYGSNYVVDVLFQFLPDIIDFLWDLIFNPWKSSYSYNNYPSYYRTCEPYPTNIYAQNVLIQNNTYNIYCYTTVRKSETCKELQYRNRRNDYEIKYPTKSFANRNKGLINKYEVDQKISYTETKSQKINEIKISTGKKVLKEWKPASGIAGGSSLVKNNKVSVSSESTFIKPQNGTSYNSQSLNNSAKQSSSKSTTYKSSSRKNNSYKSNANSSGSSSNKSTYKPSSRKSNNTYQPSSRKSSSSNNNKSSYKPASSKSSNSYKSSSRSSSNKKSTYKPANSKPNNTYKSSSKSSNQSSSKKSTYKPTSTKSNNAKQSSSKNSSRPSKKY